MFKRRLGYYLFHTYVPTCLIVIMSWISFWIKPEAVPARVTLGVTSLLTLSTQHANSQKSLPPVSYIKVRLIFFVNYTLLVNLGPDKFLRASVKGKHCRTCLYLSSQETHICSRLLDYRH